MCCLDLFPSAARLDGPQHPGGSARGHSQLVAALLPVVLWLGVPWVFGVLCLQWRSDTSTRFQWQELVTAWCLGVRSWPGSRRPHKGHIWDTSSSWETAFT